MSTDTPFRVLIAGGGIGALEAALALRELAPDRVSTTLLSPAKEFVYRPYTVAEPFSYPAAKRFPVARIAGDAGAELVADELTRVDAERKVVHTGGGQELPYDALLLALGARPYERFEHAANVDDSRMEKVLHGLVQDIEGGYVHKVAFVSSSAEGW